MLLCWLDEAGGAATTLIPYLLASLAALAAFNPVLLMAHLGSMRIASGPMKKKITPSFSSLFFPEKQLFF
jgi:hypothetical protein